MRTNFDRTEWDFLFFSSSSLFSAKSIINRAGAVGTRAFPHPRSNNRPPKREYGVTVYSLVKIGKDVQTRTFWFNAQNSVRFVIKRNSGLDGLFMTAEFIAVHASERFVEMVFFTNFSPSEMPTLFPLPHAPTSWTSAIIYGIFFYKIETTPIKRIKNEK